MDYKGRMQNDWSNEYQDREFIYNRILAYITVELEDLMYREQIPYLTITSRIKTLKSFNEKTERKGYVDPFDQMEDFCGFRVICYYRSDVLKISELLERNFDILESFNKEDLLRENEFGYRSYHMIAKIPKGRSPYLIDDSFSEYKFEIQIRTVLMHAWAEIQHKLAYKSKSQIAPSMRKEFAFLSAKLEESDFQFERLRNQAEKIQQRFKEKISREGVSNVEELNLDSLRAVLQSKFPDRKEDSEGISRLLDQMQEAKINLKSAFEIYEKAESYILENLEKEDQSFTRSGVLRTALNLASDEFWNNYIKTIDMDKYSNWIKEREEQRKYVKKMIND